MCNKGRVLVPALTRLATLKLIRYHEFYPPISVTFKLQWTIEKSDQWFQIARAIFIRCLIRLSSHEGKQQQKTRRMNVEVSTQRRSRQTVSYKFRNIYTYIQKYTYIDQIIAKKELKTFIFVFFLNSYNYYGWHTVVNRCRQSFFSTYTDQFYLSLVVGFSHTSHNVFFCPFSFF